MRENGDACARAVLREFFADGGGDVLARFEMGFLEDVIGQRAVDEDFGAPLDESLDLGLPLFRTDVTSGGEAGEHFLGTF